MSETTISADARRLARGHALESDENFLGAIGTAIELLGDAARREDVLAEATALRIRQERAGRVDAEANARKAGSIDERRRINSILTAREVEGRETVARELAFNSDLPASAAIEALKVAPVQNSFVEMATKSHFDPASMKGVQRTCDAPDPGGLLTEDGTYEIVSADHSAPETGSRSKSLWKKTIDDINARNAQKSKVEAAAKPNRSGHDDRPG